MRLLYAKPTYGPSPDPMLDKSHRGAIMYAANHGVTWVGDVSVDRYGWAAARNGIVEQALEIADVDKVDGIIWMDDDLLVPVDTVHKLISHQKDFVSALYFQRHPPHWPVFGRLNKKRNFEWAVEYPENSLIPCDGVGFGCIFTSISLLKAVSELSEGKKEPFGGDFGKKAYGEDFAFCLRAKEAEFQAWVDTSVKCQHLIGPEFADERLFCQYRSTFRRENGAA